MTLFDRTSRGIVAVFVALAALLTGCSTHTPASSPSITPGDNIPDANPAVQSLVTALQTGELDAVPWSQDAAKVAADYKVVIGGMDGLRPTVAAQAVAYHASDGSESTTADVQLNQTYSLDGHPWEFTSTASLTLTNGAWTVDWDPAIIYPDLTNISRLRHTRTAPQRASILGAGDLAIVEERQVYRIGIDKSRVSAAAAQSSAAALAALVKVDAASFVARVKAAGNQAFVEAITLRAGQVPDGINAISGARALADTQNLAPTKTFAESILGTVGPATAEAIAASQGAVVEGDNVGISGLEARYDEQLRGTPGHMIQLVRRTNPSTFGSATSASPTSDPASFVTTTVFNVDPIPGTPLRLTMNIELQMKAESVLATQPGAASLVLIDNSNGAILAAANSPASGDNPNATFGRYAPGSTFKIASSLALLRKGLLPMSTVNCPASITIDGWTYKNYSGYPATKLGKITLTDAVANSCNTAFMGQAATLSSGDLAQAAASLGVGVDYDAGFSAFYGSVPEPKTAGDKITSMIGQGLIEASPMAMAGLAASVARGSTTIPWLVQGHRPASTAQPLTASETAELRALMSAVVTQGSGHVLSGLMTGAKTGTAEYGTANPPQTHAWMIAYNQRYSIAVLVADGNSGSGVAGPIITAFFS